MKLATIFSTPAPSTLGLIALVALFFLGGCAASETQKDAKSPKKQGQSPGGERVEIEPTKIVYAMRGNEKIYRKCFMRSTAGKGAVATSFDINQQGEVESTKILWSSVEDKSIESCIQERLSNQRFGEQRAPGSGKWTFVFGLSEPIDDDERDQRLKKAEDSGQSGFKMVRGAEGSIDEALFEQMVEVNYPLYAPCYRDSIGRRGESVGILKLHLMIDQTGELTEIDDAGSILPDPFAVDCMAEAFYAITFPQPTNGSVIVEYRIDFQ